MRAEDGEGETRNERRARVRAPHVPPPQPHRPIDRAAGRARSPHPDDDDEDDRAGRRGAGGGGCGRVSSVAVGRCTPLNLLFFAVGLRNGREIEGERGGGTGSIVSQSGF